MIITFFSFKGGVGRTMALANVATQLTNLHGYRVLAIDWDLEAPGLHYYFGLNDEKLRSRPGLIDLLERNQTGDDEFVLKDYVSSPSKRVLDQFKFGRLDLMTCGRLDGHYSQRVADFNWKRFYTERHGYKFLERLRRKISDDYQICLIDARAGQSETNVPPTSQLADLLVMLFTSNEQSMAGTEDLCRRLHEVHAKRNRSTQMPIIMVPSRVFSREEGFRKWIKDVADPSYTRLLESRVLLRRHQPRGIEHVTLAIDPGASFGEQLPILDPKFDKSALILGYRSLVELLLDHQHDEDVLWRPERLRNHGAFDNESEYRAREDLKLAAERGDQIGVALISLRLARVLKELSPRHSAEARSLATNALAVFRSRQDRGLQALALHTLGQVAAGVQEFTEARELYTQALKMVDQDHRTALAVIYHDLGVVLINLRVFQEAEQTLEKSLSIKREIGDVSGQAMSTHQLGNLELSRNAPAEVTIARFREAQELAEQDNDRLGVAISSHQLANVYARQEEYQTALEWFERAAAIHSEQNYLRGSGITQMRIGDMMERLGRVDEAVERYRLALVSAHHEGDTRNQQNLHRRLAQILLREGQTNEARSETTTALRLSEHLNIRAEVVKNLLLLAEVEHQAGDQAAAARQLDEAEKIATRLNSDDIRRRVSKTRQWIEASVNPESS
jgi:tetratricopeptide (TPR) repeat protein/cellulose biosynthesis protein BcsQ